MKSILNNDKFELVGNLTTISVLKLQDDRWKIVENGRYSGEKSDLEIIEMVERVTGKGFELVTPELNY